MYPLHLPSFLFALWFQIITKIIFYFPLAREVQAEQLSFEMLLIL